MQIQLSQKERMYLEDGKIQEGICVQKYQKYAQQAQDPQLKQLFNKIATEEQHHLDTINQLLQGQQPNLAHPQQQQQNQTPSQGTMNNENDKNLCIDLLSTEKHVSSNYDIAVFESANPVVRQAFQHIQQDEQRHGEELFNYMNSHGMYNVK
ncbi:spore coat protein [Tepidibacter formicigenes]|jgi:spore coat protein CotF|uniref:Coat F domain-containing protein n=1 Tax=Tepidibacter formicigenes DSM 15518 TaxID=1123349 RepID=A0A1M6RFE1_9FIRM|nr:spore coat protein [Tepidibacter formicigenes]SHK31106.1 Coat F domain-containing protein [Tepidibacter formicigenes DSM 15518]